MRNPILPLLLVATLLGVVPESRAENAVSLRFSWPSNVVLQVDRSRQEIREPDKTPPPVRSRARFTWTGKRSDAVYRVAFSDFSPIEKEPEPRSADALVRLEYVARAVEPLLPTLVLDEAGQPLDLEGVSELRKDLRSRYESIPGLGSDKQATRNRFRFSLRNR